MGRRFARIRLEQEAAAIVSRDPEVLEDYIRAQLKKGLGKDGRILLYYRDDPFFHGNVVEADRYALWKQSLGNSDPGKPVDVADFYINGYTHNNLFVTVSGGRVIIQAAVPWGPSIDDRTDGRAFGLTDPNKINYRQTHLFPEMIKSIKAKTGAR